MKIPILWNIEQFFKKKRDSKHQIVGENNSINISKKDLFNVKVSIIGSNNNITVKPLHPDNTGKFFITLYGDNCNVTIEEGCFCSKSLVFDLGKNHPYFGKIENVNINIGGNSQFESAIITAYNSNSNIKIGKNCMFANEVNIYNTDAHPVFDADSNKIVNHVKDLIIGDHCWIGFKASVLKNVRIPDNCIVGWGAVVSKSFDEQNCAIAGNPAKIVKRNINWDPDGSKDYIKNISS